MTHQALVQSLFTRADGQYLFARWARAIVPVVFGLEAETLASVKGALEAVLRLAGHPMGGVDPELGANLMIFYVRDWAELAAVPRLEGLVPGLGTVLERLVAADANQYRLFRHETGGAIRAAFVFVRLDGALAQVPAQALALDQAVRVILLWSDAAFAVQGPLVQAGGIAVLRADIAAVIRAGYDPVLPAVARDASHALRLAARM